MSWLPHWLDTLGPSPSAKANPPSDAVLPSNPFPGYQVQVSNRLKKRTP